MSLTTFTRFWHRPDETSASRISRTMDRPRWRGRPWAIAAGIVLAVILLARFVGSPIIRDVVNRRLAAGEGFIGRVEDIDLAVWRAGLDVRDLALYTRGHVSDGPMLHVKRASVAVSPFALLTGRFVGSVSVDGAELTFIKRQAAPETDREREQNLAQTKREVHHWQDVIATAFPMKLAKLEVKHARVHFVDRTKTPNAELSLDELHLVARDLQNRPKANGDALPAKIDLTGVTSGNGQLKSTIQVDPLARQPRFEANFEVLGMQLPALNPFLFAYANADVSRGSFEVYMQAEARDGAYQGYVKPLFHDLDFRNASDRDKNAAQRFAEKVVSTVASVLKNDQKDQVATKAPFSGNFADNKVDVWTTIAELFRNAFIQALRGGFEGQTPNR